MTPGMENPFLRVQLLLQPPDATAALEWEPGAAAPHCCGMDTAQPVII